MFKQSCLYSIVVGFLFLFGFNWLFHGIVLADAYVATADMWRTPAEMEELKWWCMATQLLIVILLAKLYCKMNCCKGIQGGVCFGVLAGLLLAVLDARAYIYSPLPESLAVAWAIGSLVSGVGLGIIFSYFKSCCGSQCATSCCKPEGSCATSCCTPDGSCTMPVAAPTPAKKKAPAKKKNPTKKK